LATELTTRIVSKLYF